MPFLSKYVESLQRNEKLKKWVMTAMKGGFAHGIPGGYFSDDFAKAAVKKAIKADKDAIKKATRKRISGSVPLKRRQPRQDFFPAIHEAGTP